MAPRTGIAAIVLASAFLAISARADADVALRLGRSKTLEISGTAWGTVKASLDSFIDAYSVSSSSVVFRKLEGDDLFVVLAVEGSSRSPKGANHECGAGTEANLIWLKFDARGAFKLRGVHTLNYSSCFDSTEGEYRVDEDRVSVDMTSFARKRVESWVMSAKTPEDGFRLLSLKPQRGE